MKYVIRMGMQMLVMYGWPALARQDSQGCTLLRDMVFHVPSSAVETTDETGAEAFYLFSLQFKPIVFESWDAAEYTIRRFKLADAHVVRWRE